MPEGQLGGRSARVALDHVPIAIFRQVFGIMLVVPLEFALAIRSVHVSEMKQARGAAILNARELLRNVAAVKIAPVPGAAEAIVLAQPEQRRTPETSVNSVGANSISPIPEIKNAQGIAMGRAVLYRIDDARGIEQQFVPVDCQHPIRSLMPDAIEQPVLIAGLV